jgi:hypothetical protein
MPPVQNAALAAQNAALGARKFPNIGKKDDFKGALWQFTAQMHSMGLLEAYNHAVTENLDEPVDLTGDQTVKWKHYENSMWGAIKGEALEIMSTGDATEHGTLVQVMRKLKSAFDSTTNVDQNMEFQKFGSTAFDQSKESIDEFAAKRYKELVRCTPSLVAADTHNAHMRRVLGNSLPKEFSEVCARVRAAPENTEWRVLLDWVRDWERSLAASDNREVMGTAFVAKTDKNTPAAGDDSKQFNDAVKKQVAAVLLSKGYKGKGKGAANKGGGDYNSRWCSFCKMSGHTAPWCFNNPDSSQYRPNKGGKGSGKGGKGGGKSWRKKNGPKAKKQDKN